MRKIQFLLVILVSLVCLGQVQYAQGHPSAIKREIHSPEERDIFEDIFMAWFGIEDSSEEQTEKHLVCTNCTIVVQAKPDEIESPTQNKPKPTIQQTQVPVADTQPDMAPVAVEATQSGEAPNVPVDPEIP